MPLVAPASLLQPLEHNRNGNLVGLDNLDSVTEPHIHFGNLALVELEVVAMYDSLGLMNGRAMCCYDDFGSDHCSWNFDFYDCDFDHHDMEMVNVDYDDCYRNHVVEPDCILLCDETNEKNTIILFLKIGFCFVFVYFFIQNGNKFMIRNFL